MGATTANGKIRVLIADDHRLIAAGVNPSTVRRRGHTPLGYLVGLVSRSGAVSYARGQSVTPVWVTGEALLALTGTSLPFIAPTTALTTRG